MLILEREFSEGSVRMRAQENHNFVPFKNRRDAGIRLAGQLLRYQDSPNLLVFGIPRGGVPVAYEIACRLEAPLDVIIVRKLGVPDHEELAMGAIAYNGVAVFNDDIVRHVPQKMVKRVIDKEQGRMKLYEQKYRGRRPFPSVEGATVILVDDGMATGASMSAGIQALRQLGPKAIIAAAPVTSREVCASLRSVADHVECGFVPQPFYGVGNWYEDFSQTTDEEVLALLWDCGRRALARNAKAN